MVMTEELVSAVVREVKRRLQESNGSDSKSIPIELSARHAHISEKDYYQLFKEPPENVRELSQPGQYLLDRRLRLIGPKGVIDNVAILGPFRKESQVEISLTDARYLGIKAPVRHSGDLQSTPGGILSSSEGIIALDRGVIVAGRHIHMHPNDALRLGVNDMDLVCVQTNSDRPLIFRDVLVRVHKNYRLAFHIDFDEGNACGCIANTTCTIIRDVAEVRCACG